MRRETRRVEESWKGERKKGSEEGKRGKDKKDDRKQGRKDSRRKRRLVEERR